ESNVDPSERLAIEQLSRVAELQVSQVTGRAIEAPIRMEALNRTQWARRFLDDERPLLEGLSGSIGTALQAQLGELGDDDMSLDLNQFQLPGMPPDAMMQQMMRMLGPMLLGMMAGSTAGHLAARAFGHYELPLPRPIDKSITIVLNNIDEFAESWSLPTEGIRLWVCISDVAHKQILETPHVRAVLDSLLNDYVSSFSDDPDQIESRLRELGYDDDVTGPEPELEALQRLASNPDILLGAMQSDHQRNLMTQIEAVVATVEGYVDWVLDSVGNRLIPDFDRITEALRRRRVEAAPSNRFVERLFGLELSQATFDRGSAFIDGVIERAGSDTLALIWQDREHLPTPAELTAPGLWLARLGVASEELEFDDLGDFEIPDFPDLDS
ncbi:MAG TPA: zinc-dependent metalloprotease, partial [Microthrixaceae bacterium]|nr:zinc-dependent metalloprotease [Microthrixaceae bacterium]